jgi:hypothetical protein
LVNYAVLGEDLFDLDLVGVAGEIRDVDGTVFLDFGFLDSLWRVSALVRQVQ